MVWIVQHCHAVVFNGNEMLLIVVLDITQNAAHVVYNYNAIDIACLVVCLGCRISYT